MVEWEKRDAWARYIAVAGKRYEHCRIDNFHATTHAQRKVLTAVRAYAAKLVEHIDAGHNLLLYGSVGTGKDHLLTGLIWLAIQAHRKVTWKDGATMYREWRDGIAQKKTEDELIEKLIAADVLAVSDPLPSRGAITDFQAEKLGEIMDTRYRQQRPTWITANVESPEHLEQLTTPRLTDRLADANSVRVFLNWESYRQKQNVAAG